MLCGSVAPRAQLGATTRHPADIDLTAVPYLPDLWNRSTMELRDDGRIAGPGIGLEVVPAGVGEGTEGQGSVCRRAVS